jgi:hypothetical protein
MWITIVKNFIQSYIPRASWKTALSCSFMTWASYPVLQRIKNHYPVDSNARDASLFMAGGGGGGGTEEKSVG